MRLDLRSLPFLLLNLMGAKSYDFNSPRRESIFEKAQSIKVKSETTTSSFSNFTTITTITPTTPEVPKFEPEVQETKKTGVSQTQVNINILESLSKEDVKTQGRKPNRSQYQLAGKPRHSRLASGTSEDQGMHLEDREVDILLEKPPKDLVSVYGDSSRISTTTSIVISSPSPKVPKFEPVVKKTKKTGVMQAQVNINILESSKEDVKTRGREPNRFQYQLAGKPRHSRLASGTSEDQVMHLEDREVDKLLEKPPKDLVSVSGESSRISTTTSTVISPTSPKVPKFKPVVNKTKKTGVMQAQGNINILESPSKEDVKTQGRKPNRFQNNIAGKPLHSRLASGNSEVQGIHFEEREVDKLLEDSSIVLVSVDSSRISTTSTTISPTSSKVSKFEPEVKKTKKHLFGKPRRKRSDPGYSDQVMHLNDRQLEHLSEDSLLIKIEEHIASVLFPPKEVSELALTSSGDATYDQHDLLQAPTKILPSQDIELDIYSAEETEYRPISSNSLDDLASRFDEPDTNDMEFIPISSKYLGNLYSIVDQSSIIESPKRGEPSIPSVNVDNLSSEVIKKLPEGQQKVKVKPGILTSKNKKPSRPRPSSIDTNQIENSTTDEEKSLKRKRTGLFSKRRKLVSSNQSSLITKSPVTASEITTELSKVKAENSSNDDKPKPGILTSRNKKPYRPRPSPIDTNQIENSTTDEEKMLIHLNNRQLDNLLRVLFPPEEVSELASPFSGDATYDQQDLLQASTKILPSQDIEPDIYSAEDTEYRPISNNSPDALSNRFVEPDPNNLEFIPISSKYIGDLSSIVDQSSIIESPKRGEHSIPSANFDNLSSEAITKLPEGQQKVKVKSGILTFKNKKTSTPRPSPIDTNQIENSTTDEEKSLKQQKTSLFSKRRELFSSKQLSLITKSPVTASEISTELSKVQAENSSNGDKPKSSILTSKNKKPYRPRPSPFDTNQIENSTTDEEKSLKRKRTGLFSKRKELDSSKQSSLITKSSVTASEITTELSKIQSENSSNDDKPKLKTKTSLFSRNRDQSRKSPLITTSISNPTTRSYDSAPSTISTRARGNSIPDSSRGTEKKEDGLRKPTLFSKAARRNTLSSSNDKIFTPTRISTTKTTTTRSNTTRSTTTRSTTTRSTTITQRKIEINLEPLEIFYDLTSRSPSISTDVELVTTTIGPPVVESDTPVCPDNYSTFIIPHPDICDAFYLCQKGVVSTRFCPDNFIFSLTQAMCAPAQSGDCFGRPERSNLVLTTSTTVLVSTTTVSVSTTTTTSPVPGITCPDSVYNYIIPHPQQCDRFFICQKGIVSSRLCPDGFILSISQLTCVLPRFGHGDCDERPRLQPASGTDPCVRQNGVFPTDSCTTFVTCRDNVPYLRTCSEGTVYDIDKKDCDWTDAVLRPGCLPSDFLDFRCPNPILNKEISRSAGVPLPFGDHDRHPDPTDCRFYFICLTTGQPRRVGCGDGQVFSPTSQTCRPASEVPGCEASFYR